MEKERLQEYATRVTQANRSELVCIIYEAAIASIKEGKKNLQEDNIAATRTEIERAKGLINELLRSLDMQYTISHYLRHLYNYAYGELCQSVAMRQPDQMDHASNVLTGLLPSFQEVAKQDDSQPVMQNVQPIYAGLTYGKGQLNESIGMGVNLSRGFEA